MSKFKKFGEFIEAKKVTEVKPEEGLAGKDYSGPLATKPDQKPTKGKNDRPLPYKAAGEVESGVWTANDSGDKKPLGDFATPGITPETTPLGQKPKGNVKKLPKPKKMTTEEFIQKTKGMTNAELFNFLMEGKANVELSPVSDLYGNEFTPDPTQSIQYVCGLILASPSMMQKFVMEMKHRDGLEDLICELMDHGDTYDHLVMSMEHPDHGVSRVGKLARTMNDKYMGMMDKFEIGESVGPSLDVMLGRPGNPSRGDKTGGGFGVPSGPNPSYKDKSVYHTDAGAQSNPLGAQDVHSPKGGGEMMGMGGQSMGGQNMPQFAGGQPIMPPKKMSDGRPALRESVATHFIDELSQYPDFKSHMKKRCVDC